MGSIGPPPDRPAPEPLSRSPPVSPDPLPRKSPSRTTARSNRVGSAMRQGPIGNGNAEGDQMTEPKEKREAERERAATGNRLCGLPAIRLEKEVKHGWFPVHFVKNCSLQTCGATNSGEEKKSLDYLNDRLVFLAFLFPRLASPFRQTELPKAF